MSNIKITHISGQNGIKPIYDDGIMVHFDLSNNNSITIHYLDSREHLSSLIEVLEEAIKYLKEQNNG